MIFASPQHGEAGAGGVHRGDIRQHAAPRREAVEAALREWHARLTADCPPALADAVGYSLFAPGKRLRPLLVVLACEAVGGALDQALPAACAVEMIHTYSLVHDDLPAMDDDDLRRGLPTCHVRYGEALAILAGDALLTMAFEVLASGYAPRTAAVSCAELARGSGAAGMVGGQVLDLTADGRIAPLSPGGRGGQECSKPSTAGRPARCSAAACGWVWRRCRRSGRRASTRGRKRCSTATPRRSAWPSR